jgi:hypothetical protein
MSRKNEVDWVFTSIAAVGSMKVSGRMISETVKDMSILVMGRSMSVCLKQTKPMARESILGPTVKFMRVSGFRALNKVWASGKAPVVTVTVANGEMGKWRVTASTNGSTGIDMKASGKIH